MNKGEFAIKAKFSEEAAAKLDAMRDQPGVSGAGAQLREAIGNVGVAVIHAANPLGVFGSFRNRYKARLEKETAKLMTVYPVCPRDYLRETCTPESGVYVFDEIERLYQIAIKGGGMPY